jgi:hypothetical protein
VLYVAAVPEPSRLHSIPVQARGLCRHKVVEHDVRCDQGMPAARSLFAAWGVDGGMSIGTLCGCCTA